MSPMQSLEQFRRSLVYPKSEQELVLVTREYHMYCYLSVF